MILLDKLNTLRLRKRNVSDTSRGINLYQYPVLSSHTTSLIRVLSWQSPRLISNGILHDDSAQPFNRTPVPTTTPPARAAASVNSDKSRHSPASTRDIVHSPVISYVPTRIPALYKSKSANSEISGPDQPNERIYSSWAFPKSDKSGDNSVPDQPSRSEDLHNRGFSTERPTQHKSTNVKYIY